MDPLIITDIARFAHLLCVAIGLGAALIADYLVLSRLSGRLDADLVRNIDRAHRLVWTALGAMWFTGALLIYLRTGFDLANFSPKLFNKLIIVTILTANAVLIGRFAMPLVALHVGKSLMWLPFRQKILLAAVASVSTTSWLLALALGVSKVLAVSGWSTFLIIIPAAYLVSVLAGISVMAILQIGFDTAPMRLKLSRAVR